MFKRDICIYYRASFLYTSFIFWLSVHNFTLKKNVEILFNCNRLNNVYTDLEYGMFPRDALLSINNKNLHTTQYVRKPGIHNKV